MNYLDLKDAIQSHPIWVPALGYKDGLDTRDGIMFKIKPVKGHEFYNWCIADDFIEVTLLFEYVQNGLLNEKIFPIIIGINLRTNYASPIERFNFRASKIKRDGMVIDPSKIQEYAHKQLDRDEMISIRILCNFLVSETKLNTLSKNEIYQQVIDMVEMFLNSLHDTFLNLIARPDVDLNKYHQLRYLLNINYILNDRKTIGSLVTKVLPI